MKTFLKFICFGFAFLQINEINSQSLSQVEYNGRWIGDPLGTPYFFSNDFSIPFYIHTSLYSHFTNQDFDFGDIESIVDKWNSISGSRFNIELIDNDATLAPNLVLNEMANNQPMHNVVSVDMNSQYWDSYDPTDPHLGVLAIANRHMLITLFVVVCNFIQCG